MLLRTLACIAAVVAPLSAGAQSAVYRLEPKASTLGYHITWTLHDATGVDHALQGAAALKTGEAQVQIRAEVAKFDSGNSNRDSHMKETVEAAKYPFVTLKGVIKNYAPPTSYPATQKLSLTAQVEFHGVTQPLEVPVELTFPDATHAHAKAEFDISLDAFKIDRPSLMFKKIDDKTHITANLSFAK